MTESQSPRADPSPGHHHDHRGNGVANPWLLSAHATFHCLIGCVIGEVLGLMIGVSLGIGVWATMGLATVLALFFGLALAVWPVVKATGMDVSQTLKAIWVGEVISIIVMEIVMNAVDYWIGGVAAPSIASAIFWIGLAYAVPAGFLAGWPVNHWLIAKAIKEH